MDHVINSLNSHLDAYLYWLRSDWKGGKGGYKKLTDCPGYADCKAIVDAIHVLEKAYYGEHRTMSVKSLMEW